LSAITVGATGSYENPAAPASRDRSSYSDVGPCLDIWAPGSNILSAGNSGDHAGAVLSGTSMAAPHVAGVAALYLQSVPGANPMQVRNYLVAMSTKNVVGGLGYSNSPNRFLYAGGPSTLTVNAPASVKKKAAFTISGGLVAGSLPLAGTVKVYFGSTLKATLTANAGGVFSGSFSETATGKWTVTYGGVPLIGASSVIKSVVAK
jgi:subtilisin family serine protease